MDIERELERLTQPSFGAGPVRRLSPEEIEELQDRGEIMQVEVIPEYHCLPRLVFPPRYGCSMYGRRL